MQASDSDMGNPHEAMADRLRLCVPRDLWQYRQWLLWRYEPGQDKPRKVPYYISGARRSGRQGDAADMSGLATFDQAETLFRAGGYDGVGFAVLESSPVKAIDLDACVDGNGQLLPEAEAIVNEADSYAELSPSRGGVRILVYGTMPSTKAMNRFGPGRHLELFGTSGFVTVTGNVLGESTVRPMSPEFRNWLCAQAGVDTRPVSEVPSIPTQTVDAKQIEHLRGALTALDHTDYHQWINDGIALKCLGAVGLEMWVEYGQRFDGFNINEARQKWAGFRPTRADFRSIFARAQARGWINPMSNAAAVAARAVSPDGLLLTVTQLRDRAQSLRWAVKGAVPDNSIGMIFGASGTFKSFIALDYALHRAYGMPWMGRKTKQAVPIYLAAEGSAGLWWRLDAWHRMHGMDPAACPLRAVIVPLSLSTEASTLRAAVEAEAIKPGDIVIDTMSQTFSGEENSAKEVAEFFRRISTELRQAFECTVLIVHHSGHNATERARGSSAMLANLDFQFSVQREDGSMFATLECVKQKESERFEQSVFSLERFVLAHDEDQDEISSLAARHVNQASELLTAIDNRNETANSVFIRFVREHGNFEIVRREFMNWLGDKKQATKRSDWKRALDFAVTQKLVGTDQSGRIWVLEGGVA
ncbi:hypothetical protein H4CHR_01563 [Variovorax sp. PBS-H4]|uniref:AAA family ATPase n=1 Tax=Variovorax sp. PBS-H4 TaxID=434008 RepID=UPI0013174000|nr:AAA family ATPase [Variovorax sp. PBS-H4]VTU25282.1 hypothetical protein H4CHR_01563 [Variovorax sp. PBS-H4]